MQRNEARAGRINNPPAITDAIRHEPDLERRCLARPDRRVTFPSVALVRFPSDLARLPGETGDRAISVSPSAWRSGKAARAVGRTGAQFGRVQRQIALSDTRACEGTHVLRRPVPGTNYSPAGSSSNGWLDSDGGADAVAGTTTPIAGIFIGAWHFGQVIDLPAALSAMLNVWAHFGQAKRIDIVGLASGKAGWVYRAAMARGRCGL
jgi:hypothetical protein